MVVLSKALQVILALSVLIVFHEFGHYFWARLFHIRVDKFFLFFDIGGRKLFSTRAPWFTRRFPRAAAWETEYGIGWLPLGGYCKIAGMIDESLDTESLSGPPQPYEFRSKPAWQRLLVMSGGVLNNFLLALCVYIGILAGWGDTFVRNDAQPVYVNQLAYDLGFRTGDRILRYDDYFPEDFSLLQVDLARRKVRQVTVLRGTDTLTLYMDQSRIGDILNTPGMFDMALPFVVDTVAPGSPNAGLLRHGDAILALNDRPVPYLQTAREELAALCGQTVNATVGRAGDTLSLALQVDTLGRLGVMTVLPGLEVRHYTLWEAVPAGCRLAYDTLAGYLRDLRLVASPQTEAYKSVGSFIAIGQVFPSAWDAYRFLYILALLSIMLGVMNLLPVPALDGGHIVFCLYEMITGRKPGDRFVLGAQWVGMALLFLLMFLAFGNDIARFLR